MRRVGECNRCGDCCRFFYVRMTYPPDTSECFIETDAKWFGFHRKVKAEVAMGGLIVKVMSPCRKLANPKGARTTCRIYETRPHSCIDFPWDPSQLKDLPRCGYRFVDDEGMKGNRGGD